MSATGDERRANLRATFSVSGSSLHPTFRFSKLQLRREGIFATGIDVCGLQSEHGSMTEGGDGPASEVSVPGRSTGVPSQLVELTNTYLTICAR
nr:hypothetical protein Iba_chr01aCG3380 [Ipomoea batatas]